MVENEQSFGEYLRQLIRDSGIRYILSFSIQGEAGGCNEVPLII